MPSIIKQGQSLGTIDKERRIGSALSVTMRIASKRWPDRGFKYWHCDANCGSGHNALVGVDGSPLVFWQVARACLRGLDPMPFFCDIDPQAITELQTRLAGDVEASARSIIMPGDNQEAIEVFAECIRAVENPRYATGTVLVDPNGYYARDKKGRGAPIDVLARFCAEFPRIDVVLNLNIRKYQMDREHPFFNHLPPGELLNTFSKKHWLVSRITRNDRFLLAIGRNIPGGGHRQLELHDINSLEGREIMLWAEGKRQHALSELPGISSSPSLSRSAAYRHAAD